jgi:dihydroorotate dehydrogenase (fumarate)
MASELLAKGPGRIGEILEEMTTWMERRDQHSLASLRGNMSQQNVPDPAAFERANYMKVLQSWKADPAGLGLKL